MLTPLEADMAVVVSHMSKANKDLFGPTDAYAQAYGLFISEQACGTTFGPTFAGLLYAKAGWMVAAFCASGSISVVNLFFQ